MVRLPEDFKRQTLQLLGNERFERYLAAFDEEVPVSLRLNPSKTAGLRLAPQWAPTPVGWCEAGFYLAHRPNFTFDPLLHAGCYYVQEAASMFIHHVLKQLVNKPVDMLDLCAAPGGKSTCAVSALPEGSRLWSNEPVKLRASILSENIQKWGYADCHVTNNYPQDYARSGLKFDVVLCDVPCSGEGMFRKDPKTIEEWSLKQVEKCQRLQRDIVAQAWQCLRPGGLLIYSTCTFNTLENEENARWIAEELGAQPLSVDTKPEWHITGSLLRGYDYPVYRFIPGLTPSEGLFVALFRKPGNTDAPTPKPHKAKPGARPLLNELLPDADTQALPACDLSYGDAISYLRGEALALPPDTPRGLIALSFEGHRLGAVKNIGHRANNLYPKGWRIKSTHIPHDYETILTTA